MACIIFLIDSTTRRRWRFFLSLFGKIKTWQFFCSFLSFKMCSFWGGEDSFFNISVKSQSLKIPRGMLGCQSMRCSLRLKEAQGREERPEVGTCSQWKEDSIKVMLAASARLMELRNNQIGKTKGKVTRWERGFYLDSGSHLVILKSHPIGPSSHLLDYNPFPLQIWLWNSLDFSLWGWLYNLSWKGALLIIML